MEIHIGNLIGTQLEILKLIDGIVLTVILLGVDIEYAILVCHIVVPIGTRDLRSISCENSCRAHHEPCGQQRRQHLMRQLTYLGFSFILGAKALIFSVDMT